MFVRKKKNRGGSTTIQIIDKSNGYKIRQTIGCSKNPKRIDQLIRKAKHLIETNWEKQPELFSFKSSDELVIEDFLTNLQNAQVHTIGPELIFGTLFDRIGFNIVEEELFRHIVIARLAYPTSKLKTADYLYRYQGITVKSDSIYRFLDRLNSKYKDTVEKVTYEHTRGTLKNITVVFYDMTTLYFEAEDEDDLRKIGFSKEGRFQKPQIMLGLLVGQQGYPIGYDIFEGNTFEGHTLLPTLEKIRKKFNFPNPVVIADAALLSSKNIENLKDNQYQFIIGGRIKNESKKIKKLILKSAKNMKDGQSFIIKKPDGTKLIISYSDNRQKKDVYNRERGLRKLKQRIQTGKLTKKSINNRGYNKFLKLKGIVEVEIDEKKIEEDNLWDGLKGYVTNSKLPARNIIENYRQLWQIEKAFRISKTDLRIRPIYHYRKRRIESHICVAFVAYTIYKELERILELDKAGFSVKRAAELTHNMYEVECDFSNSTKTRKFILKMDSEQQQLFSVVQKN